MALKLDTSSVQVSSFGCLTQSLSKLRWNLNQHDWTHQSPKPKKWSLENYILLLWYIRKLKCSGFLEYRLWTWVANYQSSKVPPVVGVVVFFLTFHAGKSQASQNECGQCSGWDGDHQCQLSLAEPLLEMARRGLRDTEPLFFQRTVTQNPKQNSYNFETEK